MTSNGKNITFEQTSFLQGSNSPFIEELYLKFLNDPNSIPESWAEFFKGLNEDKDLISVDINIQEKIQVWRQFPQWLFLQASFC